MAPSILIDKRAGSAELLAFFPTGLAGLDLLPFGDAAFDGNGPGGDTVKVGIERKTIADLLQCLVSGRFSGHQLPGLIESYDYVYLIVEGLYYTYPNFIRVRHGKRYAKTTLGSKHVDPFLNTLEVVAGVIVRQTIYPRQTAELILHLYQWWQKGYEKHKSYTGFHVTKPHIKSIEEPSLVMKIAKELPGIGWERAKAIGEHFQSVDQMFKADIGEWTLIPGISTKLAEAIFDAKERKE